jgi:hypothetical protein
MMTRFMWIKRKPLATVTICAIMVAASIMYWPKSQVAEAATINPNPGLVGWWRFDEGTGTTAGDSSGNGNDGTIYGASWVDGKYGKALSFDGINDYGEIADSASLHIWSGDWSIGFWIYRAVEGGQLFVKDIGAGSGYVKISAESLTALTLGLWDGANTKFYSVSISNLEWTHFIITHKASTKTLTWFKNGVAQIPTTHTLVLSNINPLGTILLGHKYWWATRFNGIVDEVRVYNRALSATEIGNLFQKGPDFSSRLLAKVPKGTTQFVVTLSWQGYGSINVTIECLYIRKPPTIQVVAKC